MNSLGKYLDLFCIAISIIKIEKSAIIRFFKFILFELTLVLILIGMNKKLPESFERLERIFIFLALFTDRICNCGFWSCVWQCKFNRFYQGGFFLDNRASFVFHIRNVENLFNLVIWVNHLLIFKNNHSIMIKS